MARISIADLVSRLTEAEAEAPIRRVRLSRNGSKPSASLLLGLSEDKVSHRLLPLRLVRTEVFSVLVVDCVCGYMGQPDRHRHYRKGDKVEAPVVLDIRIIYAG